MATPPGESSEPASLANILDRAQHNMPSAAAGMPGLDGFLFSGNRHESIPRGLLLDRRLTPLERNAWQVLRLQFKADGVAAFPTYKQLRPYLAAMPCGPRASFETIARALIVLRLTRWLSLVRRCRDARSGRIQGNLYVLHDEPLSPWEAMQLDAEYPDLVSQALRHASKVIQRVGWHTLQEITEDPLIPEQSLPTRLHVLAQRMNTASESEAGRAHLLRNPSDLPSESEAGPQAAQTDSLRIPKQDRTVRLRQEVRTTEPDNNGAQRLRLPERFGKLQPEQRHGALAALQRIDAKDRQAVLDEWDARCRRSTIRNPAGYLFGIIQKAAQGEFRAWAGQADSAPPKPTPSAVEAPSPPAKPAQPEVVQQHIAQLRDLLRLK